MVLVTYINDDGEELEHLFRLVKDEEQLRHRDGSSVVVFTPKGYASTVGELADGKVVFEDEHGLVFMHPTKIKEIKDV